MALIIEDGSIVAGANSYATVAELDAFASLRGYTLPAVPEDKEVLLIKGTDYTESFANRYQGSMVSAEQVLQWPRNNVYVNGFAVPSDSIPVQLKNAQMQAAIEVMNSELQPNQTGGNVKSKRVDGAVEVVYQDGAGSLYSPSFPKVDTYLKPLFAANGTYLQVQAIR